MGDPEKDVSSRVVTEQEVIQQIGGCEEQAGRKIEEMILTSVKHFDFPGPFPVLNRLFPEQQDFKGVLVGSVKSLKNEEEEEFLVLTPDGLFRAPVFFYFGLASVPDVRSLTKALPEDYLKFGRLALEKLMKSERKSKSFPK